MAEVDDAFRAAIARAVMTDLAEEQDAVVALRKAILALLLLHDEDTIPEIEDLRAYLLLEFSPLADAFYEHKHALMGTEVLRAGVGENIRLLLQKDFARLLIPPVNSEI